MIAIAMMAEIANQAKNAPWPSLEWASWIFDRASFVLVGSLVVGVAATIAIVWMGIVKEHHWDLAREQSSGRIADLNNATARLNADNLALQTTLLPRHVGLIGFNESPKAPEWFSSLKQFPGTSLYIQYAPDDTEAESLANEIAIVVSRVAGWKFEFVKSDRTHVSQIVEGVYVLYPTGKPWTKEEPNQPWFAWHNAAEALADSLTKAGLGVGSYRVSRAGFSNQPPEVIGHAPIFSPYFNPPISGVYLQVGSRPVAMTVEWIKKGRPNELGETPWSQAVPIK
jgi:hypothetical protein